MQPSVVPWFSHVLKTCSCVPGRCPSDASGSFICLAKMPRVSLFLNRQTVKCSSQNLSLLSPSAFSTCKASRGSSLVWSVLLSRAGREAVMPWRSCPVSRWRRDSFSVLPPTSSWFSVHRPLLQQDWVPAWNGRMRWSSYRGIVSVATQLSRGSSWDKRSDRDMIFIQCLRENARKEVLPRDACPVVPNTWFPKTYEDHHKPKCYHWGDAFKSSHGTLVRHKSVYNGMSFLQVTPDAG